MRNCYWLGGSRLYIIEDQADTGGLYDLVEAWFPTGAQVSPHVHRQYDEQIYVLDGEFTVWTGNSVHKTALRPGNDIIIPAGTPHAVHVTRSGPERALVVASPSAFAGLIAQVGTPDEGGVRRRHPRLRKQIYSSAFLPKWATRFSALPEPCPIFVSLNYF